MLILITRDRIIDLLQVTMKLDNEKKAEHIFILLEDHLRNIVLEIHFHH